MNKFIFVNYFLREKILTRKVFYSLIPKMKIIWHNSFHLKYRFNLKFDKTIDKTKSMETDLLKRITINPGIFNGKPIIRGIRFTVTDVLDLLSAGMTPEEIIEDFPFLEKDDIRAALLYASLRLKNTLIINAA